MAISIYLSESGRPYKQTRNRHLALAHAVQFKVEHAPLLVAPPHPFGNSEWRRGRRPWIAVPHIPLCRTFHIFSQSQSQGLSTFGALPRGMGRDGVAFSPDFDFSSLGRKGKGIDVNLAAGGLFRSATNAGCSLRGRCAGRIRGRTEQRAPPRYALRMRSCVRGGG